MDKQWTPQQGDLVERGGEWHFISWIDNGEPISASDGCTCVGAKLILPACDSMAEAWDALKPLFPDQIGDGSTMRTLCIPSAMDNEWDEENWENAGYIEVWYRPEEPHFPISVSAECNTHDPAVLLAAHNRMTALRDYLANVRAKEQK